MSSYRPSSPATALRACTQRPSATVTVALDGASASSDLEVSPSSLAFAPDAWFVPQRVALSVPQDFVDEGVTYGDALRATASCTPADDDGAGGGTCAEFDGVATRVGVRVDDDDAAGIVLGRAPLRVVVDGAGDCYESARYTLRLTSQPTSNVTLALVPSSDYLALSSQTLTITPERWNATRAVDVCARSPRVEPFVATLRHNVSSRDARYDDSGTARRGALVRGVRGGFATPNATVRVSVRQDGLPAPMLRRVQFFDSGAGATVSFNEDTNRAGLSGAWGCEKLFNNSNGAFAQSRGPGIGYLGVEVSNDVVH